MTTATQLRALKEGEIDVGLARSVPRERGRRVE